LSDCKNLQVKEIGLDGSKLEGKGEGKVRKFRIHTHQQRAFSK
jgi:hypothetical protein